MFWNGLQRETLGNVSYKAQLIIVDVTTALWGWDEAGI